MDACQKVGSPALSRRGCKVWAVPVAARAPRRLALTLCARLRGQRSARWCESVGRRLLLRRRRRLRRRRHRERRLPSVASTAAVAARRTPPDLGVSHSLSKWRAHISFVFRK
uniref:Uncharacterized protein n=1 Tax=Plectus sambesii TaxID=2011161 RepID=A0A914W623_9BILA